MLQAVAATREKHISKREFKKAWWDTVKVELNKHQCEAGQKALGIGAFCQLVSIVVTGKTGYLTKENIGKDRLKGASEEEKKFAEEFMQAYKKAEAELKSHPRRKDGATLPPPDK